MSANPDEARFQNPKKKGLRRQFRNQGASPLEVLEQATGEANASRPAELGLGDIREDIEAIQVRVDGLIEDAVEQYAAVLENGGTLDPVVVFEDEHGYWLADGYHRKAAYQRVGRATIPAYVRGGGRQAAIKFAETANLQHGRQLTNADKKNILFRWLRRGDEKVKLSNRQLGSELGVSEATIRRWVDDFNSTATNDAVDRTQTIGADGKVRDTSNIGAPQQEQAQQRQEAASGVQDDEPAEDERRTVQINQNGETVAEAPLPTGDVRMGEDNRLVVERPAGEPSRTSDTAFDEAPDVEALVESVHDHLEAIRDRVENASAYEYQGYIELLDGVIEDIASIQQWMFQRQ